MDYSIATRVQTPDSFQTIGNMLNFARSATELQRARETLEADIARSKADSSRAVTEADVAKRTANPRVSQQEDAARQAQIKSNLDQFKLTGDYAQRARDISQQLVSDPDVVNGNVAGIIPKIVSARQMMIESGVPAHIAEVQAAHLMQAAAQDPKSIRQLLLNSIQAGVGSAGQAANVADRGIQVGDNATTSVVSTNAFGQTPPGQPIPGTQQTLKLPLADQQNVQINPVTQSPMTITKSPQGVVQGVTPTPSGAGIPQLAPGQPQDIPIVAKLRAAINSAAASVPETRFNNAQIIKLADETNTGKGAEILRNLKGGYAGLPWTLDTAKNFDTLGHFIARESVNAAKAMNAGTDAARILAEQSNTSTGWTREAIKSAAKVNDALATGLENFNRGMEKAIAASGGNILAVRPFQNEWTRNFDPNVYRFANALESGDKAEITRILGPEGSAERKAKALELARKSAVLNRLTTEGR